MNDTISTNESIEDNDNVNILDESFDTNNHNIKEEYNNNIDILYIIKIIQNNKNKSL
jgi:hypothetical protein